MTKRTRLFVAVAVGILIVGLGTGLVASYVANQNVLVIGADGPDELAYVPADARMVAFADVRQIMDSDLRQKVMQFHGRDGAHADGSNEFRDQTGIDIERDVDQVIASMAGDQAPDSGPPLVLARGRFDQGRIEALAQQKGAAIQDYKGIRVMAVENGQLAVAFVEPGLAAFGSTAAVHRAIDTKMSGNDVRGNADLMRLLRQSDDGNAWAVARFDALTASGRLPDDVAAQLPAITWFSASGYVNGGIRGTLRAETRDEVAAQDLRQVLQGFVALARMQTRQRPEFADLLNSFQLGGDGNTVSLGFSVPSELIDAIGAMTARRPQPPAVPLPPTAPQPPQPPAPSL
jgi:hypothetical protein